MNPFIIRTRKLKATDTLGERIRATAAEDVRPAAQWASVTSPWDYSLNEDQMHEYAARCAAQLALQTDGLPSVVRIGETVSGYLYRLGEVNES